MAIGIAWQDGAWVDAGWVTGAWNQTLPAPVFTGTIPNITGNEGDPNIVTDLSTYFTGATSYSISPAVEPGWNFDTVTGILTVDTDLGTFGPYTVTGTNATGSDSSNAFSVVISTAGGGISKRRKAEEDYKKAFDLAKWRKDQRRAIESAVAAERKPGKLKPKKSAKIELSKAEIQQIASIDESINRQLAIEFELRRLYKRKQDEALAVLLLM